MRHFPPRPDGKRKATRTHARPTRNFADSFATIRQDVTIAETGASPSLIDLGAITALRARAAKARGKKTGAGHFDPLLVDTLE